MEVRVEIQGVAEALNEGDGAAAGPAIRGGNARPAADRGEHGAHEDLRDVSDQGRVVGKAIAKGKRHRQHPLADRHFGKDSIHQMRGSIGHTPSAARRTEASAFAGIRHDPIQAANIAVHPQKTSGQDAAIKKGVQLPFHEPWHQPPAFPLTGQKGLEMAGHRAIEHALFRPARTVLASGFPDGEVLVEGHKIAPFVRYFLCEKAC